MAAVIATTSDLRSPSASSSSENAFVQVRCLQTLKARGVSVLLIEQKLTLAMAIADRVLVMGRGRIVFDGPPARLQADAAIRQEWLEV